MLGKLLAYFLVGLVDMVICMLVGVFIFQVPFRGSVLFLLFHQLPVSVRRAVLGHLDLRDVTHPTDGLSNGHASSFLPGFLLSGFVYSISEHAEGHPGD